MMIFSVPANWLTMQMSQSPEFAAKILEKLLDVNKDGNLTPDELAVLSQD